MRYVSFVSPGGGRFAGVTQNAVKTNSVIATSRKTDVASLTRRYRAT
jgi:hypothetical protein